MKLMVCFFYSPTTTPIAALRRYVGYHRYTFSPVLVLLCLTRLFFGAQYCCTFWYLRWFSTITICFYSYHTFWKLTIRCSAYQVLHLNQKRRNQRNLNIRKNLKDTYHTHIVMRLLLKENWGGCTCTCSTRVAKLEGLAGNTDGMNKISFGTNF